ncbi:hypothetical protein Tco_0854772 [Tanacetum coccineum]
MPTLRTTEIDMIQNDEALKLNLDLLEEKREQATIRKSRSKAKMEKYNNFKVRNTSFKLGDLVYRNNDASHAEDGGKLGPKWEGPYEVTEALGKGAQKLRDHNGKLLSRTWNVRNLKKYYVHEMIMTESTATTGSADRRMLQRGLQLFLLKYNRGGRRSFSMRCRIII